MKKLAALIVFMLVLGGWGAAASASYYFKDDVGIKYYLDTYIGSYAYTYIYGLQIVHTNGNISRGALLLDVNTWDLTITSFEDSNYWGYSIEAIWNGGGTAGYMINSQGATYNVALYFYSQ